MSRVDQLRKMLSNSTGTQTGEVLSVAAPMYRVALAAATVSVPIAVGVAVRPVVGDWVAVSDGAIVARIAPLTSIPSYTV